METKKSNTEAWHSRLFRTVNSAICFSLAYVLFNYLYWFSMVFAAKSYGCNSFLYYYGVKMLMGNSQWNKGRVAYIYSAGPLTCLIVALAFLFVYRILRRFPSLFNVFLLWGFIIGTSIFVGQGLIVWLGIYNYGSPFYQGLAVVFSWSHVPGIVARLLTIPLFLLFVYFALNYGRPFLLFSFSYSKVNKLSRKRKFFFEIAMVPFALGGVITTILTYPMNIPVHVVNLSVIGFALIVAWYTLGTAQILRNQLLRYNQLQVPNVLFSILFTLVCLAVYATYRGMYVGL